MAFIDLKSVMQKWEVPSDIKEERAHEFRENYFRAAVGFSLPLRISPVRSAVQRQFQTPANWKGSTTRSKSSKEKPTAFTTCATLPLKYSKLATTDSEKNQIINECLAQK